MENYINLKAPANAYSRRFRLAWVNLERLLVEERSKRAARRKRMLNQQHGQ